MNKQKFLLLIAFLGLTLSTIAQKIMNKEGDLSFLAGIKELNIEYDYSNFGVGDYDKEEDYVNKKVEEYNKKEKGTGERWKESWFGSRERVYQPKFEELLNKGLTKLGITASTDNNAAKYTLIVKTTFIEPGYNIGVSKKPAAVSFEYIFVETESKKVVGKYTHKMVPGAQAMGMDYDTSTRISESYAKAGKMLAAFMVKGE